MNKIPTYKQKVFENIQKQHILFRLLKKLSNLKGKSRKSKTELNKNEFCTP